MSIRDIKTYAAYLLLLGAMYALPSCRHREQPVRVPDMTRPIELSASTLWPDMTKGIINGAEDLINGDGFVVWASWHKDPADPSVFSGDYASGTNQNVFGVAGTKVYAKGPVSSDGQASGWDYAPTQYWYRGTYSFAAAMPASAFNATYAKTEADKTVVDGISGAHTTDNKLLLPGYSLGGGTTRTTYGTKLSESAQTDLMYAFANVDNKRDDASAVSLSFKHAFSLLGIRLASDEPDKIFAVQSIKIYGIHNSISEVELQWDFDMVQNAGESEADYIKRITSTNIASNRDLLRSNLTNKSAASAPYATFFRPTSNAENWDITSNAVVLLVEDVLVFPEELSSTNSLEIQVTHSDGKILTGTISTGAWEPGQRYVYTLAVDSIEIGEPEVTPWITVSLPEIEIE